MGEWLLRQLVIEREAMPLLNRLSVAVTQYTPERSGVCWGAHAAGECEANDTIEGCMAAIKAKVGDAKQLAAAKRAAAEKLLSEAAQLEGAK
jgi:hypothetical protein